MDWLIEEYMMWICDGSDVEIFDVFDWVLIVGFVSGLGGLRVLIGGF